MMFRKPSARRMVTGAIAAVVGGLFIAPQASAEGEPAADDQEVEEIIISSDYIERMRENKKAPGELPAIEQKRLAQEAVEDAKDSGSYLDVDSVDIVPLLDGNMQVAIPVDTQIESVRLESTGQDDEVSVTVEGSGVEDGNMVSGGPQMASNWLNDGGTWS